MSVFSVPVTIGVDEEKIAKEIQAEAKEQVINRITLAVTKTLYKKKKYYSDNYDDPEPMREMVKEEIAKIVASHQDEIIKAASELLADKLSRMKVVKEAAVNVAKEKEPDRVTYGDIYKEFQANYPEFAKDVEDYRPYFPPYRTHAWPMNIVIWLRSGEVKRYSYETKVLYPERDE